MFNSIKVSPLFLSILLFGFFVTSNELAYAESSTKHPRAIGGRGLKDRVTVLGSKLRSSETAPTTTIIKGDKKERIGREAQEPQRVVATPGPQGTYAGVLIPGK